MMRGLEGMEEEMDHERVRSSTLMMTGLEIIEE